MVTTVHFLNVGWGDAHIIQLPSGKVTLIDGGDGAMEAGRDHPLEWMIRNGVQQLDELILTHIHEDHLNGLIDIARNRKVIQAIVPYEPFTLPSACALNEDENPLAYRVYRMLSSYLELLQLLQVQGTEISCCRRYGSANCSLVWSEEGYELNHLYPWEGDPLPAYETLQRIVMELEMDQSNAVKSLEAFFELSNHDSSVYRLTFHKQQSEGVLFGGDQLQPGWERIAKRTALKSRVWKVPHHGLPDGFNAHLLALIQPEYCIIPISLDRADAMQTDWNRLRHLTAGNLHLTGSVPKEQSKLVADGEIQIRIGDMQHREECL